MAVTQYIGSRYVPIFADPIEWSASNTYEPLTIVIHAGNSYTSKQAVPKDIDISNEAFWALTGNYNAQVELYRRETAIAKQTADDAQADADAAQADIDTLLPKSDFSAENTVKKYVDDSVAVVQTDIDTLLPKSAFSTDNTIKDYVDASISEINSSDIEWSVERIGDDNCDCVVIKIPKSRFISKLDAIPAEIRQLPNGRVENPDTILNYAARKKPFIVSNITPSTCMRFENRFYGTDAPITVGTTGIFGQKTADSDVTVENPAANGTMADLGDWYSCNIQYPVIVKDGVIVPPAMNVTYFTTNPIPCYGYDDNFYWLIYPFGRSLKSLGVYWRDLAVLGVSKGIQNLMMMDGGGSMACIANGSLITPNLNTDNTLRNNSMCLVINPIDKATSKDYDVISQLSQHCDALKRMNYMFTFYNALLPHALTYVSAHEIVTDSSAFAYVDLVFNNTVDFVQEGVYGVFEHPDNSFGLILRKPINNGNFIISGEYRLPGGVTPPTSSGVQVVRRLIENGNPVGNDTVISRIIFTPVSTAQSRQSFSLVCNTGTCRPVRIYDENNDVVTERHWEFWITVPNYLEFRDVVMTVNGINYNA